MKGITVATLTTLTLLIGGVMSFAQAEGSADEGKQLAKKNCTPCHVIILDDLETKFEIAPRFEELTRKSEEELRSRLMMRHVMMPQFPELTLGNVADISAYLKSLSQKK